MRGPRVRQPLAAAASAAGTARREDRILIATCQELDKALLGRRGFASPLPFPRVESTPCARWPCSRAARSRRGLGHRNKREDMEERARGGGQRARQVQGRQFRVAKDWQSPGCRRGAREPRYPYSEPASGKT